jgi:hypothetical protein
MSIGAGPFAYCRGVRGTAAATPSLRRRLIGGFRGRAGRTGSTTRSQPPTCSGELIEMRLAQVEFVAGRAVVHSNRRHGLGAVTVKIAGKHDTCCLSHDTSVQRQTCDRLLAQVQSATVDPLHRPGFGEMQPAQRRRICVAADPSTASESGRRRHPAVVRRTPRPGTDRPRRTVGRVARARTQGGAVAYRHHHHHRT